MTDRPNHWDLLEERGHPRSVAKRAVLGAPYGLLMNAEEQAAWGAFCDLIKEQPEIMQPVWGIA